MIITHISMESLVKKSWWIKAHYKLINSPILWIIIKLNSWLGQWSNSFTENKGQVKELFKELIQQLPGGLVVRIRRSHRRGRGSIPRLGSGFSQ